MVKRLFLTGPTGCGKSRLIREALGDALAGAGGFVMAAESGPGGYAERYVLRPAAAAAGIGGLPSRPFLDCRVWPPERDNECFRELGVRLLREAVWYPFAVLDELGGHELLIPQFREALEELLRSDLPLLGALKTPEETEQWRLLFGLGERFPQRAQAFRQALAADPGCRILDLRETTEAEVLSLLREWKETQL